MVTNYIYLVNYHCIHYYGMSNNVNRGWQCIGVRAHYIIIGAGLKAQPPLAIYYGVLWVGVETSSPRCGLLMQRVELGSARFALGSSSQRA
jgi:hypothetical protein